MPVSTNAQIRQLIRQQRRELSTNEQNQHAQALANITARLNVFRYSKRVALYLANDGEIDPHHVVNTCWNMGKQVYLPVLSPLKNQLYFAPYQPDTDMKTNRYGISEPDCHPGQWIMARQLDVLFLPLVAFDSIGNRIGMGGGFYDRSLAYLSGRRFYKKPRLIGLAHELQHQPVLQNEKWDIPLTTIITEKRVIQI